MTPPAVADLFDTVEATWPAARVEKHGGWSVRHGLGGGQRVSSATMDDGSALEQVAQMERAQRDMGQWPLVQVRDDQKALDTTLSEVGYVEKDRTLVLTAASEAIAGRPDPLATYPSWPPLAAQIDLWADGGIGPERIAVMDRVSGRKTTILGRLGDEIVSTAFVACHGDVGMLHGLEVIPGARRKGVGSDMMRAAGSWAQDAGAKWFSVLVVEANEAAVALYKKLGFEEVAAYHYRRAPEASA